MFQAVALFDKRPLSLSVVVVLVCDEAPTMGGLEAVSCVICGACCVGRSGIDQSACSVAARNSRCLNQVACACLSVLQHQAAVVHSKNPAQHSATAVPPQTRPDQTSQSHSHCQHAQQGSPMAAAGRYVAAHKRTKHSACYLRGDANHTQHMRRLVVTEQCKKGATRDGHSALSSSRVPGLPRRCGLVHTCNRCHALCTTCRALCRYKATPGDQTKG